VVCVDNIYIHHLLECTQRCSSLKLWTGEEGWTAICVSSRAFCGRNAGNKDIDEITHALSGPTAERQGHF
jgi:hypothetical protein